ncbi:hypothetical protein AVEN_119207-1 [Araneus ventricosus]|uniref:Uncharacterized protein n=1 Tax=Araneus ventricosus TaxID=182803 RepID=A0A4Y2NWM0_ARAVE|nr:hypothetical protein AVEN_119207-1 [Araneus ventricosus]
MKEDGMVKLFQRSESERGVRYLNYIGDGKCLTDNIVDKLSVFYGNAIRKHSNSVKETRNAVWAIYFHMRSTDNEPMHSFCPTGETSWCPAYNQSQEHNLNNPHNFNHLLKHPHFKVSWIKDHANYRGNEKADELAKAASTSGFQDPFHYPISCIEVELHQHMLQDWQQLWQDGTTGTKLNKLLPLVSLHPTLWPREIILFLTEHGLFPQ